MVYQARVVPMGKPMLFPDNHGRPMTFTFDEVNFSQSRRNVGAGDIPILLDHDPKLEVGKLRSLNPNREWWICSFELREDVIQGRSGARRAPRSDRHSGPVPRVAGRPARAGAVAVAGVGPGAAGRGRRAPHPVFAAAHVRVAVDRRCLLTRPCRDRGRRDLPGVTP